MLYVRLEDSAEECIAKKGQKKQISYSHWERSDEATGGREELGAERGEMGLCGHQGQVATMTVMTGNVQGKSATGSWAWEFIAMVSVTWSSRWGADSMV